MLLTTSNKNVASVNEVWQAQQTVVGDTLQVIERKASTKNETDLNLMLQRLRL